MPQLEYVCHSAKLNETIYILSQEDTASARGEHGRCLPCQSVIGKEVRRVDGGAQRNFTCLAWGCLELAAFSLLCMFCRMLCSWSHSPACCLTV